MLSLSGTPPGRGPAFVRLGCFPGATRVKGDSQFCGEGRRLAPRPCAGTPGWAVSIALVLGNFWPIGPASLGPSGRLRPRLKGLKQVPRPARRYWQRVERRGRGHHAPPSPSWFRAAGAAASCPPAARPGPLRAGRGRDERARWGNQQEHQPSLLGAVARKRRGARAPRRVRAAPSSRQLRSSVATRKKEGGSGATGGPGQGVGVIIHSHWPHPLCRL